MINPTKGDRYAECYTHSRWRSPYRSRRGQHTRPLDRTLTLRLAGFELDITLGREPEPDDLWIDCGTTGSYPVGFVRSPLPEWEVPGSYHQFEPDD